MDKKANFLFILEIHCTVPSSIYDAWLNNGYQLTKLNIVEELKSSAMLNLLKNLEECIIAQDTIIIAIDLRQIDKLSVLYVTSILHSFIELLNVRPLDHLIVTFIGEDSTRLDISAYLEKITSLISSHLNSKINLAYYSIPTLISMINVIEKLDGQKFKNE
ncbi:MAG: hypothetical protein CL843_06595 [Crocinitomicaceae bacterium]|nr:hypothetical protein [Crocinitomicaceae bacterium]|tara:strand:- start:1998 stop:2480 length:483 start_codon:yes stop_codon:yes gene_type:complete